MDPTWNGGYGNTEINEFVFNEFIDSSNLDDEDAGMMMMISIQEEMEKSEEDVLNFMGCIKGRRVIPRHRIVGARLLYTDYFTMDPTYHEGFFRRRFQMSRDLFST